MPSIPGTALTFREVAQLYGSGAPDPIIDLIAKSNTLLEDMVWRQGNQDVGHKFRLLAGIPGVNYRSINEGVLPNRGTQTMVTETCSLLESVSEIDKELVDIAPNGAAFRTEEAAAHIEGMTIRMAEEVWYGNRAKDARGIMGLAERYSRLTIPNPVTGTGTVASPVAHQIIDLWGMWDNKPTDVPSDTDKLTSVWLVGWGDRSVFGIYPKNTRGGVEHIAEPLQAIIDTNPDSPGYGGTYQGYRDRFKWRVGLVLMDYRQIVRIANVPVDYLYDVDTGPDLIGAMLRSTHRIWNMNTGRFAFYMNRTVSEAYDLIIRKQQPINVSIDQYTGTIRPVLKGIPIKIDDNLLDNEQYVE